MTLKFRLNHLFWAALLILGCATADQQLIDPPPVEYQGMTLKTNGLFDANPVFRFHIENPNPMGMTVHDITYSLFVNDRKFVKGVSGQNIRILAGESSDATLSIYFSFLDLYDMASLPRNAETIHYALSGDVRIGPFAVPYRTTGQFEVPHLPEITLRSARTEKTDGGRTALLLDIRINNPNPFQVVFEAIDYRVRVDDENGLGGRLNGPVSLDPGADMPMLLSALPDETPEDDADEKTLAGRERTIQLSGEMIFISEKRPPHRLPFQATGTYDIRP